MLIRHESVTAVALIAAILILSVAPAATAQDTAADSATESQSDQKAEEPATVEQPPEKAEAAEEALPQDPQPADEPAPESKTDSEGVDPGQADLDKAFELKLTARGIRDLNQVIELLDSAIEKGIDEGNQEFAEGMLVASLMQRATALSAAVLDKPVAKSRKDLRWLQVRQFALTDLQRVIELDNTLPEAYLLVGRLQSLPLGDPNAARRALGKVVAAEGVDNDDRAQAYALRAATQRDPKKRLEDFGRAIELDPSKIEYRLVRAREHQRAKDYAAALADLEAVLDKMPENPGAHEMKALILLAQDKPEDAIKSLDRATELAPELLGPYQYRGEAYNRLGDTEEAIRQLDKAIEIDPNNAGSRLVRSQLYLMDGQPEAALMDLEAVLVRQPGLVRAHLLRVQVLEELGRRDDAIEVLQRIAQAASDKPDVLIQLASFFQEFNEYGEAIDVLSSVIQMANDNVMALRLRGDMYLSVGRHTDALADFAAAFELQPDDAGLLNNYAWTLATSPFDDLRDGKRAVELATRAAELTDFDKPHVLSTLAAAYAELGDFDQAIEYSEKALALEKTQTTPDAEALEGLDTQLQDELASYRAHKPWRELQQAGGADSTDNEKTPASDSLLDPAGDDEPGRAFDF